MHYLMKRYAWYSILFVVLVVYRGYQDLTTTGICVSYLIGFAVTTIAAVVFFDPIKD